MLFRSAENDLSRLPAIADELIRQDVDVLVAINTPGTRAAISATTAIPIVMVAVGDPVATGFVASVARPGGNVTGVTNLAREITGKRLALLKEAVPSLERVAVILNPDDPVTDAQLQDIRHAAVRSASTSRRSRSVAPMTSSVCLRRRCQHERRQSSRWRTLNTSLRKPIADLAMKHRLSTMVLTREDAEAGGMIAYWIDQADHYRRAAGYVDRILRGDRPGDLPVEQPTVFEFTVNLRTARALGIALPDALVARANHIIE